MSYITNHGRAVAVGVGVAVGVKVGVGVDVPGGVPSGEDGGVAEGVVAALLEVRAQVFVRVPAEVMPPAGTPSVTEPSIPLGTMVLSRARLGQVRAGHTGLAALGGHADAFRGLLRKGLRSTEGYTGLAFGAAPSAGARRALAAAAPGGTIEAMVHPGRIPGGAGHTGHAARGALADAYRGLLRNGLRTTEGVTGLACGAAPAAGALRALGEIASLQNPALDRILYFAAEVGLVVILHSDVDMPFARARATPVFLQQMQDLLRRHPKTTIIWAHIGLGRVVHPVQSQATAGTTERNPAYRAIVEAMLNDPTLSHVYFDISWDEVAKYAVSSPESITNTVAVLNKYPDRFLFGTDTSRRRTRRRSARVRPVGPVWKQLTPEASRKVRLESYERLFDAGRRQGLTALP